MRALLVPLWVATVGACGTSNDLPPLTNATSLQCPAPGDLPFRTVSNGFQMSSNKTISMMDTRFKDEASDTIGNPGGPFASVYLDQAATPTSDPIAYHGVKARTGANQGLEETPLVGEYVSAWYVDNTAKWVSLGRAMTGEDGSYDLPSNGYVADNASPVYAMLEADGSCAASYNLLLAPGSKVIVTDIDGTLTTSDQELITQLGDESYVPMMMTAANTLMQTWAMKGYPIIYLTARANEFRAETSQWLGMENFPIGATITGSNSTDAQAYKTVWLERMVNDFGWDVIAGYGNADTDIGAYQAASLPNSEIFIVGPQGGDSGSTAIPNMDFTDHITNYVDAQPDNN
jgi:hypothetical protein